MRAKKNINEAIINYETSASNDDEDSVQITMIVIFYLLGVVPVYST